MCGRTACTLSGARMRRVANISSSRGAGASSTDPGSAAAGGSCDEKSASAETTSCDTFQRKYNISPTGVLPIVMERATTGERRVLLAEWGLRPPHVQHLHSSTAAEKSAAFPYSSFNARVEGLTTSKLYKGLLNSRRCVMVVDGFYEWKKDVSNPKQKQPFFIRMRPTVREKPIPFRGWSAAEKQLESSKDSSSSHVKSSMKEEQHHEHSGDRRSHTAAHAAFITKVLEEPEQQHAVPASSAGKRRRGSSDVKTEQSSNSKNSSSYSDSTSTTMPEVKKDITGSAGSSSAVKSHPVSAAKVSKKEAESYEEDDTQEDGGGTLRPQEAPLLLAGLYNFLHAAPAPTESGSSNSGEKRVYGDSDVCCSVTILTMSSKGTPLEELHTRIPVALSPEGAAVWLDCASTSFDACIKKVTTDCVALYKNDVFFYAVTPRVGNSRYEESDCTEPLISGAAGASGDKKKQGLLLFDLPEDTKTKRPKHEEVAEQRQIIAKSERSPSPQQQGPQVGKTGEKEAEPLRGSSGKGATKQKQGGPARSTHGGGMKSMDYYFKRAPPKKQHQ